MNKADIVEQVLAAQHLEATLDKLYKGKTGSIDLSVEDLKKEGINFNLR